MVCEKSRQDGREVCTACGKDLTDLVSQLKLGLILKA